MLQWLIRAAALLAACAAGQGAWAQSDYPNRKITLVVPYVAGASTDTLGRIIAKAVGTQFDQTVLVENKVGAGGVIAADYLRRQKPDGYTFMLTTDGIMSVNPSLHKSLPYDPQKDFEALTTAAFVPVILIVRADSPFKSMQDIIDYARQHPPGTLTYASSGMGTSQNMAGELFNQFANVNIKHIPYKGGAPAMTDLLGGHVSMMFAQIPSSKELAEQGKIRILGLASANRVSVLPDVATFDELGLKGYDSDAWYGFMMPAGAPEEVSAKLHRAIVKAIDDNRQQLESLGFIVKTSSRQEIADGIRANTVKWAEVLRKAGLYKIQ